MFSMGPPLWGGGREIDPLAANVRFLLSPQFMPLGSTVTDQSAYAAAGTHVGGTQNVSATRQLFGGNTIELAYYPSDASYLTFPMGNYWLNAHSYTIELWVYLTTRPATGLNYLLNASGSGATHALNLYLRGQDNVPPGILDGLLAGLSNVPSGQWVHVCFMRVPLLTGGIPGIPGGFDLGLYINGVRDKSSSGGSAQDSADITYLRIGGHPSYGSSGNVEGFLGGVRFTSGVGHENCRYNGAGFTPPTAPFPLP